MAHVRRHFEEVQMFRESRWIWYIFIPFTLVTFIPIGSGIYQQLVLRHPWGDRPMNDATLLGLFFFTLLCWCLVAWMLYSVKLEVYIDTEGIHYRFFPNRYTWRLIVKGEIVSYEIHRKKNIVETGGIGYHRNLFRNSRSMIIKGSVYIRFVLSGNRKILIGTQNPEAFDRAIRRLFENQSNE